MNLPERFCIFPREHDLAPRCHRLEQLKWLVDHEGRNLAGSEGLGLLASVGLVNGKPFNTAPPYERDPQRTRRGGRIQDEPGDRP